MLARLLEDSRSSGRRRNLVRSRQFPHAPHLRLRMRMRHAGVAFRLPDDSLKLTEQLSGGSFPLFPIFHEFFKNRRNGVVGQDIPRRGLRRLLKRFGERSFAPKRRLAGDHKLGEGRQARETLLIKAVVTPKPYAQRLQERAENDRGGIVELRPELRVGKSLDARRKRRQVRLQRPASQVPPRDNIIDRHKDKWHLGGDGRFIVIAVERTSTLRAALGRGAKTIRYALLQIRQIIVSHQSASRRIDEEVTLTRGRIQQREKARVDQRHNHFRQRALRGPALADNEQNRIRPFAP
jgi:hypothetical protein